MFDRCFVVSDVRAQMVPTSASALKFNPMLSVQSAASLIHAIMATDVFLSTCYAQGQKERERFLGLQRVDPTNERDMSGLHYEYSVSVIADRFMPGVQSNRIQNAFNGIDDTRFRAAISRHIDQYVKSLNARHEERYDDVKERICVIVCHPTYRDAVIQQIRATTLRPAEVEWTPDGNVVIRP